MRLDINSFAPGLLRLLNTICVALTGTPEEGLEREDARFRCHALVYTVPALLQHSWRLPGILGIPQPQTNEVTPVHVRRNHMAVVYYRTYCFSSESLKPARAWKMLRLLAY